jgi:hypothetical protein
MTEIKKVETVVRRVRGNNRSRPAATSRGFTLYTSFTPGLATRSDRSIRRIVSRDGWSLCPNSPFVRPFAAHPRCICPISQFVICRERSQSPRAHRRKQRVSLRAAYKHGGDEISQTARSREKRFTAATAVDAVASAAAQ